MFPFLSARPANRAKNTVKARKKGQRNRWDLKSNAREGRNMNIDEKTYDEIAELIHSDESPVGIDAKKTHIYIIHKLNEIEKRLEAIEKRQA